MSAARGPRPAQRRSFGCRRPYGAALLLLLVGRSTGVAEAQAFETVGVRALGMGGAFVAVADDATANYWNPAGLIDVFFSGVLDVQRIDTRLDPHPTRREGASNLTTFASLASPTLGLSYYRLRSWQVARVVKGPEGRDVASLTSLVTHHGAMTVVQPLAPGLDDCVCSEGRERYGGDGAGRRDGTDRGPARADIQVAGTLDDSIRFSTSVSWSGPVRSSSGWSDGISGNPSLPCPMIRW